MPVFAQQSLQELMLSRQLDSMEAELLVPVEDYRRVNRSGNDFLGCPLALYSRRHRLELRVYLEPIRSEQEVIPTVRTGRMAAQLASNDAEEDILVYRLGDRELHSYGADWGKALYFIPKKGFTQRKKCEMIALYKMDRGMAYVVLLYDEENEELRRREQMFRFKE